MNKQQLAAKIWESANKMRSKIEANEYKDYILGFIFYKFLCEKEIGFMREQKASDDDIKKLSENDKVNVTYIQDRIGYFIAYKNLFSTWVDPKKSFNIKDVQTALTSFTIYIKDTHKKVFEGIFDTLEAGLPKLGTTSGEQTKAASDLIKLIKDIPMGKKQDYDVLGFVYEYLISNFAANAGKKAGEFYTPHEVSLLMAEIIAEHLHGRKNIQIYDPTSGSGSLLINIGRAASKYIDPRNIRYYAQELKQNTFNLTRMNLIMRGISPSNIVARNGDTLEKDWPYFEENDPENTYSPLFVDAVVSNPPYSQQWKPDGKENDVRFKEFGVAPSSKADYAFLLHDLYHLKDDGIMTIVLPHGVLFRGKSDENEGKIRKNLIEQNRIDAIIGLPANIFFGTGIPTIIMVLKKGKKDSDILIVDASKHFLKVGKNNVLQSSDIRRIVDTVTGRKTVAGFSRLVTRDEVRTNDYNLNIPRYVDSSEKAETYDIYASMFGGCPKSEIDALDEYWKAFPSLKGELFAGSRTPYLTLRQKDIAGCVRNNSDVVSYTGQFEKAFSGYPSYLSKHLIENVTGLEVAKEEEAVTDKLFKTIDELPLADKYAAYQIFSDEWKIISEDIEMIQTEGFNAVKQVDPNLVMKKDEEVQDGWKGHVLPFELVQRVMLKKDLEALKAKQDELEAIGSKYEDILSNLSDEERELPILNDDGTAFVPKDVDAQALEYYSNAWEEIIKKSDSKAKGGAAKHISDIEKAHPFEEGTPAYTVIKVYKLQLQEKAFKKELGKMEDELHLKTKGVIESLADDEAKKLLKEKWITPLVASLAAMPEAEISSLIEKLTALTKKYETTFADVEEQIGSAEKELAAMVKELDGSEYDVKGLDELCALFGGK